MHSQGTSPDSTSKRNQHHYHLRIPPGKPEQVFVGIVKAAEPAPKFTILCQPDDDSIACQPIAIDQDDGSTQHYYYFENFGMSTVEVTLQRIS